MGVVEVQQHILGLLLNYYAYHVFGLPYLAFLDSQLWVTMIILGFEPGISS